MSHLEWAQRAYYESNGGDRVGLLALDDGHSAVVWAYAAPHSGMQLLSVDPERAQEVFETARTQAETSEGLRFDSRQEWMGSSL
ncbi:hypothetical protein [Streptomyces apricus]|uniref:Uncharacterized protein n=1 Tax=Streptomyces apricus TaxID=1828112 RepID=A0A5B0A3K7_9ACTN|nr:hypothetical protein [Streptomyces apricus]KAA0924273.1 hypothetical protein FGF04_33165 [Streptomyces apricus]